jgi:predicted Zn-dependent protease
LTQHLEQYPNDAFARYGLALEYANGGDVDAALREFDLLLESNPEYVPGYQMAGQTLMRAGKLDQAREMLHRGVACAARSGNAKAKNEMEGLLDELR